MREYHARGPNITSYLFLSPREFIFQLLPRYRHPSGVRCDYPSDLGSLVIYYPRAIDRFSFHQFHIIDFSAKVKSAL